MGLNFNFYLQTREKMRPKFIEYVPKHRANREPTKNLILLLISTLICFPLVYITK